MRCTCRPSHSAHVVYHGSCTTFNICIRNSRARYLAAFSLDVRPQQLPRRFRASAVRPKAGYRRHCRHL